MSKINNCDYHLPPKDIDPSAKLAAINVGANSVTETGWATPAGYMLCEHNTDWLDFVQIGDVACGTFRIPSDLSTHAVLLSFNSGYHIESTEIWQDAGQLWKCDVYAYKRPDGTFQAFTYQNRTQKCLPFALPDRSKLPDGAGSLTFVGLNADLDSPWEFFYTTTYQGRGTYVVRCIYNYSDPWDQTDPQWIETYNDVASCDWWYGLKSSDLPLAA